MKASSNLASNPCSDPHRTLVESGLWPLQNLSSNEEPILESLRFDLLLPPRFALFLDGVGAAPEPGRSATAAPGKRSPR